MTSVYRVSVRFRVKVRVNVKSANLATVAFGYSGWESAQLWHQDE